MRGGVASYLQALHDCLPDVSVYVPRRSRYLWPQWLPAVFQTWREMHRQGISQIAVSHLLPMGYVALTFHLFFRTPFFVFVHGLDVARAHRSPWKRWWASVILARAKMIIANSEFTKGLVLKYGVMEHRVTVITPCILTPPDARRAPEAGLILSVGRLVARKNHEALMRVVATLQRSRPSLRLVILGDGPQRGVLEQSLRELNMHDAVTIISNATDAERDAWYRRASIFALPTISEGDDVEGFGVVFLEAAARSIPVVAGCGGGVSEAVVHGVTGLVVDPRSDTEIADALRGLLDDPKKAEELGNAARVRVSEMFTCASRRRELMKIYGGKS